MELIIHCISIAVRDPQCNGLPTSCIAIAVRHCNGRCAIAAPLHSAWLRVSFDTATLSLCTFALPYFLDDCGTERISICQNYFPERIIAWHNLRLEPIMVFKKGHPPHPGSGNPNMKRGAPSLNPYGAGGNPNKVHGARTKATARKVAELNARGDLDPLDYLSSLVTNPNTDAVLRAQAAQAIMPYRHSRMGNTPVPPEPVFFDPETEFHPPHPEPRSVEEVNSNITYIHQLKLAGKLDQAWANDLINDQRIIGNNLLDHAKLLLAQGGPTNQVIEIRGGLPELPGTDIILPNMNGAKTIDAQGNLIAQPPPNPDPKPSIPGDTSLPVNHEDPHE